MILVHVILEVVILGGKRAESIETLLLTSNILKVFLGAYHFIFLHRDLFVARGVRFRLLELLALSR